MFTVKLGLQINSSKSSLVDNIENHVIGDFVETVRHYSAMAYHLFSMFQQ